LDERTAEGGVNIAKSGEEFLIITPKGAEELRSRHHQLDVTAKNILKLIEQGATTTETILQRSMFPHNAVVETLRRLLTTKLVALTANDGVGSAHGSGKSGPGGRPARRELRLKFEISPAQARFALSNFCMDQFGTEGQYFLDAVSLCVDVMSLQEVLNSIRSEVDARCPDRLAALFDCVREINETDAVTAPSRILNAPAPGKSSNRPASSKPAASSDAAGSTPVNRTASNKPASGRPVWDKPVAVNRPAVGGSAASQLRLDAGISLAQARFSLTEFCLNQFGVGGQELVDAINRCSDAPGLQKVLNVIRNEIQNRHPERLPALATCLHEINETAL
jgi:hypothetical protein